MDEVRRVSLLTAIARSRDRVETIIKDSAFGFGAIAEHEKVAERHVQVLAPIAYRLSVAPRHSGHRGRPRAR